MPASDSTGEAFHDNVQRKGLPPALVKQLTQVNPLKSTLALLETWGVIALAVAAAIYWWHPLAVIPALLVIATRQQALIVLAHDATHYRIFRTRWLNDAVGRLCGGAAGISMSTYRVVHRLHHNHLYETQDPDIPLHGGYPRGRAYLARKLAKDLLGGTAWKTYSYFFGAPMRNTAVDAANRPLDDTSPALRRAANRDRWFVAGLHVAAPIVAFAFGYGVEYLVLWPLPLVTLLQPLLRLRAIAEHGAVSDLSAPETAARTNTGPAWFLWLMFPHHVHYHIEHHLYPSIPHYNLPECHRRLVAHGALQGAEVRDIRDTLARVFADRTPQTAEATP